MLSNHYFEKVLVPNRSLISIAFHLYQFGSDHLHCSLSAGESGNKSVNPILFTIIVHFNFPRVFICKIECC